MYGPHFEREVIVNGTTHAVTGTALWLVGCATAQLVGVHPAPVAVAAGTILAYAAGYGPDIDSARSTAAMWLSPSYHLRGLIRTLWPATRRRRGPWHVARRPRFAPVIGTLVSLLGHREWTHTLIATLGVGLAAGLLRVGGLGAWWVGLAVAVGWAGAIAGDMCTIHGCPVFKPLSDRDYHLLPEALRLRTGHGPELIGVAPMLWAVTAWAAIQVAGTTTEVAMPWQGIAAIVITVWMATLGDGARRWKWARARAAA